MPDACAQLAVQLLNNDALERGKTLGNDYQLRRPRRLGLSSGVNPQTMAQFRRKSDDATTLVLGLGKGKGRAGPAERPRGGGKGTGSAAGGAGRGLCSREKGFRRTAATTIAAAADAGKEEIGCRKGGVGGGRRSLPQA